MLARFENGYFLEVVVEKDIDGIAEYAYHVYNEDFWSKNCGWTEYRSMEMHYPMNEIDYILNYCNPKFVKGKYELLPCETMEEYEDFLEEDPKGKWILETQGTDDDDIRYYKTEEAARIVMMNESKGREEKVKYCNIECGDYHYEISGEGYYQCWNIYEREMIRSKKKKLINEIELELVRIDRGVSQYACELQDTWVIRQHIEAVEALVEQLKELM